MNRAMMKWAEVSAAPAQKAEMMNKTAEICITVRRPMASASRPAMKAPKAQPSRMAPTLNPVPSADRLKVASNPSWVPLMTPES
jgi:hypothetical protein